MATARCNPPLGGARAALVFSCVWLGLTSMNIASPFQEGTAPADAGRLWESLEQLRNSAGVDWLAVVLVEAGSQPICRVTGTRWEGSATDFRVGWGSLSEIVLGLGLSRMEAEARIRPADRIDLLCPELAPANPWGETRPLRLEHLLEHTSGLAELPAAAWTEDYGGEVRPDTVFERFSGALACLRPPGRYVYATYSELLLLAAVLERLSGKPLARWADETVAKPLGLRLVWTGEERPDAAPDVFLPDALRPVLGLTASLGDAGRMLEMFLNRGSLGDTAYLSEDAVLRMETPASSEAVRQGLQVGYGLGLRRIAENGWVWIGQDSRLPGAYAGFRYLAGEGRGAFVAFAGPEDRAGEVWELVEAHLTRDLEPPAPLLMEIPENRLLRLEGYYLPATDRWAGLAVLHWLRRPAFLEAAPGRLEWTSGPHRLSLFPVTDRRFRLEGEPLPTVVAVAGPRDEVELMALSQAFFGNFRRVSAVRIWSLRALLFWHVLLLAGWLVLKTWYWIRRGSGGGASPSGRVTVTGMVAALLGSVAFGAAVGTAPDPESWEFAREVGSLSLFSLAYGYAPWMVLLGGLAALVGGFLPRKDAGERELLVWGMTAGAVAVLTATVVLYLARGA
ncbi:MAG: hypothetical protein Kow00109_20410 [Acidobacteriota bacterium]